jgi:hypothetical protein
MIARRLAGVLLTAGGAAGLTACILSASSGMRDVMRTDGGSCASGGPYVSVHPCSSSDMRLLMVGIMGGLVATAVYSGGTSVLGLSPSLAGLLAWTGLFGALGWNFIAMDLRPPAHRVGVGVLLPGGAFWVMALGGLVLFLLGVGRALRNPGRPDPAVAGLQPLVMAAAIPGVPGPVGPLGPVGPAGPVGGAGGWALGGGGWAMGGGPAAAPTSTPAMVADPRARRYGLLRAGTWLTASLAGAGAGITLSSSLITMLR